MKASAIVSGAAVLLALAGCGSGEPGRTSASGGVTSTGGHHESGGAGGGSSRSGGTTQSGGATGSGGTTTTGGTVTGGTISSGGTTSSGGSRASGGVTSRGGATGLGGREGTGGDTASGGVTASGGASAAGGVTTIAGRTGTNDASAQGGGSGFDATVDAEEPACVPEAQTCTEADKTVTSGIGKHCCYTYENWVGAGNASLTLKKDGFSVNWSNARFVGRKGIRPGSEDLVINYNANFQPNGNGYLAVYGWTKDPLVEYYVLESWGSYKPPGGSSVGTVTSDGATYEIYKSMRNNEDSIIGKATFPQYWSVRQQKRTSGTITLANHVKGWAGKSMPMGSFYEVSMTVEGYQSSGTADVKFSIK